MYRKSPVGDDSLQIPLPSQLKLPLHLSLDNENQQSSHKIHKSHDSVLSYYNQSDLMANQNLFLSAEMKDGLGFVTVTVSVLIIP